MLLCNDQGKPLITSTVSSNILNLNFHHGAYFHVKIKFENRTCVFCEKQCLNGEKKSKDKGHCWLLGRQGERLLFL